MGVVDSIPVEPPAHSIAVCVFEAVRAFMCGYEKSLCQHRSYTGELRRGSDMAAVYAAVRRDPPAPVDVFLLHSREGVVREVDEADQAVELEEAVGWEDEGTFVHQGRQLTVHMATPDKVWLDSTAGILPGHTLVQRSGLGKLSDIFAAFVSQWSQRWCRHDFVPPSQWDGNPFVRSGAFAFSFIP